MINQTQTDGSSGDNVGGNKITYYNIHLLKKKQVLIFIGLLLLFAGTYTTYHFLPSQCTNQKKKLRVDIAYFEPTGNHSFTISLKNILKEDLKPFSVKIDGHDDYLLKSTQEATLQKSVNQIIHKKCNYKGLIVYGNRDKGEQTFHCWIDVINVKRDTSLLLREPPIDFTIPQQASYVSDFIKALTKYYLGIHEEALKDFKAFLKKGVMNGQTKKITSICYTYMGIIYAKEDNLGKAQQALAKAYEIHPTKEVFQKLGLLQQKIQIAPTRQTQDVNKTPITRLKKENLESKSSYTASEDISTTAANLKKSKTSAINELYKFFNANARYPVSYLQRKIYKIDTVRIRCLVGQDGSLRNYKIVKTIDKLELFKVEAIRLIKEISNWAELSKELKNDVLIIKVPFSFKNLQNRDWDGIKLVGLNLGWCNFQGTTLQQSDFSRSKLENTDFTNCDLQNTKFKNVYLWGTKFDGANLQGASFSKSSFSFFSVKGANLKNTSFLDTKLDHIEFKSTILPNTSYFRNVKITNRANFSGAYTTDSQWANKIKTLKYIAYKKNVFDHFKTYVLFELTPKEVKEAAKKNKYLTNWDLNVPLYEIRFKETIKK